jgi:hypothetical protein
MLKTLGKSLLILILFIIIISQLPLSLADNYGLVHGRALDRNGNALAGVKVTLLDEQHKVVGNQVTDAKGEFAFNQVPLTTTQDVFMLRATLTTDGGSWSSDTGFFNVLTMQVASKDISFLDYPSSGVGGLYGIVTSDVWRIIEEPATIYLSNGMFILYPGNRYDQWSFDQLAQGKYVIWAERNINNVTYTSERYNVTVFPDDKAYQPIILLTNTPAAYHQQPVQLTNVVHGTIVQKNGAILPGAKVDLYSSGGSAPRLVATTTSNVNGQYSFTGVDVSAPQSRYLVRVTYEADGAQRTMDSDQFTVYFANTLNVSHDYDVPIGIPLTTTGSASISSKPAGAQISVDGADTGHLTPYNLSLKSGTHTLGLAMNGYFGDVSTLQVQPDTNLVITRTLKLSTGNLSLAVNPANAQIYFDGQLAGTGQLTVAKKPAGEHTYVLVCDGFGNMSGRVDILPGESVTKELNMVASPGISLTYIAYLIGSFFDSVGHIF